MLWRAETAWGSGWSSSSQRSPRSTASARSTPCPTGASSPTWGARWVSPAATPWEVSTRGWWT
eukprot:1385977-Alexandrium_andersonii.AAC.1